MKQGSPEKEFGDALMKAWAMQTHGWFYRMPDARHLRGTTSFSHPRPADYIVTCAKFTAFVETKWLRHQSVIPWNTLADSQRRTIESTRGTSLRYYVVVGHHVGAFVFYGHDILCMNKRWTVANTCPVVWYPSVGYAARDLTTDMLE